MTYYVEVTVTQEFNSRDEAEAFADKVLESTKGSDFSKKIRLVKPKNAYSSGMGPYTYGQNTVYVNSTAQKIANGLLRDGE